MNRVVESMRQLMVASTHHLVFDWCQVVLGASCEYYRRESDEDVIELAEILHDSDLYRCTVAFVRNDRTRCHACCLMLVSLIHHILS